jgi:hypothetical protein
LGSLRREPRISGSAHQARGRLRDAEPLDRLAGVEGVVVVNGDVLDPILEGVLLTLAALADRSPDTGEDGEGEGAREARLGVEVDVEESLGNGPVRT